MVTATTPPRLAVPPMGEIPEWMAMLISDLELEKGAGHKYIRKVPTGRVGKKGKPIYRYYYKVTGGHGLAHDEELRHGSAFKIKDSGREGHFHIVGVDGDNVVIEHDESKRRDTVSKASLRAMLHAEHAQAIAGERDKHLRNLTAVEQHGSEKQKATVRKRAQAFQENAGGVDADVPASGLVARARKAKADQEAKAKQAEEDRAREAKQKQQPEGGGAEGGERSTGGVGGARKRPPKPPRSDGGTRRRAKAGGEAEGADQNTLEVTDDMIEKAEVIKETPQPLELALKPGGTWTAPKSPAITLHDDLLPVPSVKLPEEVHAFPNPKGPMQGLFDHQIDGAARILTAWKETDGIVLQDDAGLGKTVTALAAMVARERELAAAGKPGRHLVIVPTGGKANLKSQWKDAAQLYGIPLQDGGGTGPGFYLASYDELYEKIDVPDPRGGGKMVKQYVLKADFSTGAPWSTVAFDEAHNMTNPDSARAQQAIALQDHAEKALYMSATPYTNLADMHYLRKLGLFKTKDQFHEWAEMAGARVKNGEVKNPSSPLPMAAVAATFHVDGIALKRTTSLEGVTSGFQMLSQDDLPAEARDAFKSATDVVARAAKANINPMILRALYIGWSRQYLETLKVDHAIELGKAAIAEGKQVAFFTSFKDADHAHLKAIPRMIRRKAAKAANREDGQGEGEAIRLEMIATALEEDIAAMPKAGSAVRRLAEAFGGPGKVAEIHGATTKKPEQEQAAYQAGTKKVVVATMARGGTGVSLHDTVGNAPRVQINLSLPWSGREFVQVAGRSHRLGSKSNTEMHWLVGDDPTEKHNAAIVAKRLQSMGSLTQGDPEATLDASALAAWEFGANNSASESDDVGDSVKVLEEAAQEDEQPDPSEIAQAARDYFREFAEQRKSGRDVLKERYDERKAKEEEARRREVRRRQAQIESKGFAVTLDEGHKQATIGSSWKKMKEHAGAWKKAKGHTSNNGAVLHVGADKLHEIAERLNVHDDRVDLQQHARWRDSHGAGTLDFLGKRGLHIAPGGDAGTSVMVTGNTYDARETIRSVGGQWDKAKEAWRLPRERVERLAREMGHQVGGKQPEPLRRSLDHLRGMLPIPRWLGEAAFGSALAKGIKGGPVTMLEGTGRYYVESGPTTPQRIAGGDRFRAAGTAFEVRRASSASVVIRDDAGHHAAVARNALDRMIGTGYLERR